MLRRTLSATIFRSRDLPLWRARDDKLVNLQTFVLARRDLVADWLAYRNRRDAPNAGPLRAYYDSFLREFEVRIDALDAEIRSLIESCAETVVVQSDDGDDGDDGAYPGDPGMPGSDGESVVADAGSVHAVTPPLNEATATGGEGGTGGNGVGSGSRGNGGKCWR